MPPGPATTAATGPGEAVVEVFAVADLVDAMQRMPFPRVELVGPEGARPEPPISLLGAVAIEQLPDDVPGSRAPVLQARDDGDLVVKASPEQQAAIRDVLVAWRESWPLLWPATPQ